MTSCCPHTSMKHAACADAYLDRFLCSTCGHPFLLPRMIPKPQMRWLKAALRQAKAMKHVHQPYWFEVPASAKDINYMMFFLSWAGYAAIAPEGSAVLLCRATGRSPHRDRRSSTSA